MLKRVFTYCTILLLFFSSNPLNARKKVGLVLGGGGAKGVAHIGALKVLEEAGIPIDYVAGTSMGALVGALYAIGYSPNEIDSLVALQDWQLLLSDKVKRDNLTFPEKENSEKYVITLPFGFDKKDRMIDGMVKGQSLQNLFSNLTIGYHDSVDFRSFPIPFSCVAVNIVDGKDYVFQKGSLPVAMRASMAIPAVFTPVKLDSMVLVDGGLNNNYPADVAKEMGADIIIGVDLGSSDLKERQNLNSSVGIVSQIVALHGYEKYQRNLKVTDLLIRPDLHPYNSTSFTASAIDTMIIRGEEATRKAWPTLMELKKEIGITDSVVPISKRIHLSNRANPFLIRNIHFEGADPHDEKWLLKICKLKENSYITLEQLHHAMAVLVGTNAYSNVSYKLIGEESKDLYLIVAPKSASSINVGVRFDTDEIVGVLLNGTFDYHTQFHSHFSVTGRIGKKTYGRIDYSLERNPLRSLNFAYKFTHQDLDIYKKGEKYLNTTFRNHFAEFSYSDMNWLSFRFRAGIRYENWIYKSILQTGTADLQLKSEDFFNYFVSAHFETLDKTYFPTKGISLKADYTVYTDNFIEFRDHSPFSALSFNFTSVVPLKARFSIVPSLYGRVLIGKESVYPYKNIAGNEMEGHFIDHQMAFDGIHRIETFKNAFMALRLQLRQQIGTQHYILLTGNYGMHDDSFFRLPKGNQLYGGSIGYAYNAIFGPINASLSFSNQTKNVQFYANLGFYF